jgi:hypothetical protein
VTSTAFVELVPWSIARTNRSAAMAGQDVARGGGDAVGGEAEVLQQERGAPVSSGCTNGVLSTRSPMPSAASVRAACSARETIVPTATTVTSSPAVSRIARPGVNSSSGALTSGTAYRGIRR